MPVEQGMALSPSGWRVSPAVTKASPVLAQLFLICRWMSFSVTHPYMKKKQLTSRFVFLRALQHPSSFQSKGIVTLTLSDMKVTRRHHDNWTLERDFLYSVRSVGLYIIISVPSRGITLIWDKHTWITVELQPQWRVSDEDYSCIWITYAWMIRPHW